MSLFLPKLRQLLANVGNFYLTQLLAYLPFRRELSADLSLKNHQCDRAKGGLIPTSAQAERTVVQTIFSTDAVHPRDKLDLWQEAALRHFADHDCVFPGSSSFEANIQAANFGNLELVQFHVTPLQVVHSAKHVEHTKPGTLYLCYQISGRTVIDHVSRVIEIGPGDLTLLDPLQPYDMRFETSQMLVVKAPRQEMRARLGRNSDVAGRRVTAERMDDRYGLELVAKLPSIADRISSVLEEMIGTQILDLLGLSIARTLEGKNHRSFAPKATMLSTIRTVVEARLTDPNLDAQMVADAAGVSVRYANDLLAEQDTSLNRFILARRLARCRYAFENPSQSHRTISEIAFEWGFSDVTHFGRRFKEAFGIQPNEYRKLTAQSGEGRRF